MTTHFSSGVTNVKGKGLGTSLFSGIKQPLITGGTSPQEVAYQNDFVVYNSGDWDVTSGGASDYQLVDYAGGWLRLGDGAPAHTEVTGISGKELYVKLLAVNEYEVKEFTVAFPENPVIFE